SQTPPPNPLPEAESGSKTAPPPSPLRGGGQGEGVSPSPFGYGAWIEAVRAGHTFVTNGPPLHFTAGGKGPGAVLAAAPGQRLPLRVELSSAWPCDRLEILVNGAVVASKEPSGDRQAAVIQTDWQAEASAWVAARCWGETRLADGQCPFTQTSPVYAEVEGRPFLPAAAVIDSLV